LVTESSVTVLILLHDREGGYDNIEYKTVSGDSVVTRSAKNKFNGKKFTGIIRFVPISSVVTDHRDRFLLYRFQHLIKYQALARDGSVQKQRGYDL